MRKYPVITLFAVVLCCALVPAGHSTAQRKSIFIRDLSGIVLARLAGPGAAALFAGGVFMYPRPLMFISGGFGASSSGPFTAGNPGGPSLTSLGAGNALGLIKLDRVFLQTIGMSYLGAATGMAAGLMINEGRWLPLTVQAIDLPYLILPPVLGVIGALVGMGLNMPSRDSGAMLNNNEGGFYASIPTVSITVDPANREMLFGMPLARLEI